MERPITGEIPLVGRNIERDRITSALRGADAVGYVLAGAAGVGKTRLAAEVAQVAVGMGHATAFVAATTATATIPFGAFAPFIPAIDIASDGLLGLLRHASQAIVERAEPGQRLLLVVDDAHLLDDGSAALVHQLLHSRSCDLLATVRTLASAPEPIVALWMDGLADRIDLDPLSEADVAELAVRALGGPVAGASVRRLWLSSGGNPLFLRELLVGASESGALVDDGGIWALRRPLTAPDRLAELVDSRLRCLSPETVSVVELLAAGEPLGLALLERLSTPHALEDAERQGLVEVRQDGKRSEARLAHPIYGEVLRQRLPRSRLRRLWATLAEVLETTGARRREDLLRLARWQLDAGVAGDPAILGRAARRASQMFDTDLAARLARAAFDSGGGVEAGLALGEAEFSSGRHEEAERVLAGLVLMCANDEELALVANARAYNLAVLIGDQAKAADVLDEALAVVTDVNARLRLLGRMATNKLFEGDPESVVAAATELLGSGDDMTIGRGAYVSSIASALLGRTADAVATARLGLEAHRRLTDGNQLPQVQLIGSVLGHVAAGDLAKAELETLTGYEACLAAGDKEGQATFSLLRGWVGIAQGHLAAASKACLEGASLNRESRDTGALRWCLGGLALAEAMAGHLAPASAAMDELDSLSPSWMTLFEAELIDRSRAWVSVAAGEVSRGCDELRKAAERAATNHQWVAEAHLLHDLARLGDPASVVSRLAALAETVDGGLVATFADDAAALERGSGGDLEAVALSYERIGAFLLAAEARSAAATRYLAEGLTRRATASAARAAELIAECGDVWTPGLGAERPREGRQLALTRREHEIAALAAGGATTKEIAAKLFISVRTVENHLQAVYGKLGVTSREELAQALRPQ
ncbi:MAG: LuxR C-terminal-related transcriptional regulator [Acidimicrobiales bacterium]